MNDKELDQILRKSLRTGSFRGRIGSLGQGTTNGE